MFILLVAIVAMFLGGWHNKPSFFPASKNHQGDLTFVSKVQQCISASYYEMKEKECVLFAKDHSHW